MNKESKPGDPGKEEENRKKGVGRPKSGREWTGLSGRRADVVRKSKQRTKERYKACNGVRKLVGGRER